MTEMSGFFSNREFEDLRGVFYAQAYELVEVLQDELLKLERAPGDGETLKSVKRHVHTLKGDAFSIGHTGIGTLCHRAEDLLSFLAQGTGALDCEVLEVLFSAVDAINRLLLESENGSGETNVSGIMERIALLMGRSETTGEHAGPHERARESVPVRPLSEYQELQIRDALNKGLNLYEIEMMFHPMCAGKSVAVFIALQRLNALGHVINSTPGPEDSALDTAEKAMFLVGTQASPDEIREKLSLEGVTGGITIGTYQEWTRKDIPRQITEVQNSKVMGDILKIEASKVDRVMNLVGELIIGRSMVDQIAKDAETSLSSGEIAKQLFAANSYLGRTVSDLQMWIMKMRMVPVNQVFRKFPKMVRDLSVEKNKQVRLSIQGKETELDKSIVDALGEPLSHLIRNAVDHGIEEPSARRSLGKPEEGAITLNAYHQASRIVIEVSDDGGGIDAARLKRKAVEQGFLAEPDAEELSYQDSLKFIFYAGLSTSESVSETSGRGVGMDAVKAAIEGMKGTIEVESARGTGTTFRLKLPLTLSVIKALLFQVEGRQYAIPVSAVTEIAAVTKQALTTIDGREVLMLRDRIISVIQLKVLFGLNGDGGNSQGSRQTAIILDSANRDVGLLVDRLSGQQELVVKAIDRNYTRSDLVSGASILGNGKVVLILDAPAIVKKAIEDEQRKMVEVGG